MKILIYHQQSREWKTDKILKINQTCFVSDINDNADKSENSNLCWLESFVHGIADKVTFTGQEAVPTSCNNDTISLARIPMQILFKTMSTFLLNVKSKSWFWWCSRLKAEENVVIKCFNIDWWITMWCYNTISRYNLTVD